MASKHLERLFIGKMLRDLGWAHMQVTDGDEPPDFFLIPPDGRDRIAVEVTRIYRREKAKGSPEAAQEREFETFVAALQEQYLALPPRQPIQVTVVLPTVIRSSAVRRLTTAERRRDAASVTARALARFRHLPPLAPLQQHRFQVRQRDGRPVSFHVTGLPPGTGLERKWDVMNNTVGWVGRIGSDLLQRKVSSKARALAKYRTHVESAFLLVVADGSRASGFLELDPEVCVAPEGFDAVYFLRFPFDTTTLIPSCATHDGAE